MGGMMNGKPWPEGVVVRERGTVSERHARRLEALDAVVDRLLKNEAKLIADSITASVNLAHVEVLLAQVKQELEMLREHYVDWRRDQSTFWGRLRWLLLGR
jgi:hypothetical protein